MKEGALHVPAQSHRRRSTASRRVDDLPVSHQDSKGPAHRDTTCGSLKNQHTRQQRLLSLARANSSTNTLKICAKPKDMINKLLGGLENFFRVWVASHELQ
jgi:hypothetical protein